MKIDSIFVEEADARPGSGAYEVGGKDARLKVCRFAGMIYETVLKAEGDGEEEAVAEAAPLEYASTSRAAHLASLRIDQAYPLHPARTSLDALPPPPLGVQFRALLKDPLSELVLDIQHLAGRFYPNLLNSPFLDLNQILTTNTERARRLWSLAGLAPGIFTSMGAEFLSKSRKEIAITSDLQGTQEMLDHWNKP